MNTLKLDIEASSVSLEKAYISVSNNDNDLYHCLIGFIRAYILTKETDILTTDRNTMYRIKHKPKFNCQIGSN